MAFRDYANQFAQDSAAYARSATDLIAKQPSILDVSQTVGRGLAQNFQIGMRSRPSQLFSEFRNWVYAATNAIGERVACQPWMAGQTRVPLKASRAFQSVDMSQRHLAAYRHLPGFVRQKAPNLGSNFELFDRHPILDLLSSPNHVQTGNDLLYMCAVSLLITGEAYVIGGELEDGSMELWAIPTNWIAPLHNENLFSHYALTFGGTLAQPVLLENEQVLRLHIPNPTDFTMAYSPLEAVFDSAKTDTKIQRTQEDSFDTGLYPNVVISIGRLRNAEGQLTEARPILKGHQRRQIVRAVKQLWKQSVGQGDPAIIDGLIESIHKLQNTPQEMDYQSSSEIIKKRILQAFRVNPIILGEVVGANRAQAIVAEQHFLDSAVNPLSTKISEGFNRWLTPWFKDDVNHDALKPNATGRKKRKRDNLIIWIDRCSPLDEDMMSREWGQARTAGDVTRDEYRAERLGLSPLDELDDPAARSKLFDTPQSMAQIATLAQTVQSGGLDRQAAIEIIVAFFEIDEKAAEKMIPEPQPQQNMDPMGGGMPGMPAETQGMPGGDGASALGWSDANAASGDAPTDDAPTAQQPAIDYASILGWGKAVENKDVRDLLEIAHTRSHAADLIAAALMERYGQTDQWPGFSEASKFWHRKLTPRMIEFAVRRDFSSDVTKAATSLLNQQAFRQVVIAHNAPLRIIMAALPPDRRQAVASEYTAHVVWVYDHSFQARCHDAPPAPGDAAGGCNSLQHVLAHAYAHGIYAQLSVESLRAWSEQYHQHADRIGKLLTAYSATNAEEGFCEAFAIAVHPSFDGSLFTDTARSIIRSAVRLAQQTPVVVNAKHLSGTAHDHDQSVHGRRSDTVPAVDSAPGADVVDGTDPELLKRWADGLSREEQQAIMRWGSSGLHMRMQQRGDELSDDATVYEKHHWDACARALPHWEAATDRAPTYAGEVYRGLSRVPEAVLIAWGVGAIIQLTNDQSATYDREYVNKYVGTGRSRSNVSILWQLEQESGRNLGELTRVYYGDDPQTGFVSEKEIVLPKGVQYRVVDVAFYDQDGRRIPDDIPDYWEGVESPPIGYMPHHYHTGHYRMRLREV